MSLYPFFHPLLDVILSQALDKIFYIKICPSDTWTLWPANLNLAYYEYTYAVWNPFLRNGKHAQLYISQPWSDNGLGFLTELSYINNNVDLDSQVDHTYIWYEKMILGM